MKQPDYRHSGRWTDIAVCAVIVATAFLLYGNTLNNSFVFDDIPLVVENSAIRDWNRVTDILGMDTGRPMYRPLRFVTYLVDYSISGLSPVAYHVSNILYHALATCVLYALLKLLSGSASLGAAGALLFLAHPVQTDSVAYISGRRDILCGLFYFLSFYLFVLYRTRERALFLWLCPAAFLGALAAKEMAITLPAVCFLYDFSRSREPVASPKGTFLKRYGLYILLVLAGLPYLYYKLVLYYPSLRTELYGGGITPHIATVLRVVGRYIQLCLFPVVLQGDYSYNAFPVSKGFFEPAVLMSAAVIGVILLGLVKCFSRNRLAFLGGMWFCVSLLPVCHLFPHHELLAEHYLYIPMAGAVTAAIPGLQWLFRHRRRTGIALLTAFLLLFSVRTIARNRDWRDPMTFWSKVVQTAPDCARAHDNLGSAFFQQKQYQKALQHHTKAVALRPNHGIFRNNLGMDYGALGEVDKAAREFQEAIRLNPKLAAAYNNLGIVDFRAGKYLRAVQHFYKSVQLKPDQRAWINGAKACLKIDRPAWAITALEEALKLNQSNYKAWYLLGASHSVTGDPGSAIQAYQRAISIQPRNAEAFQGLAEAYLQNGEEKKAVQALQRCVALRPDLYGVHFLLGKLQEKQGDFAEAAQSYTTALAGPDDRDGILYRLGMLHAKKMGDRQKGLWYLKKSHQVSQSLALKQKTARIIRKLERE